MFVDVEQAGQDLTVKHVSYKYIVLSVVQSEFLKRDFYSAQEFASLAQSEGLTTPKKDHQSLCYFLSTLSLLHIALF